MFYNRCAFIVYNLPNLNKLEWKRKYIYITIITIQKDDCTCACECVRVCSSQNVVCCIAPNVTELGS